MTATLFAGLADHLDARANPPEALAMDAWYRSDCGHSRGCVTCEGRAVAPEGVCPTCGRCASCAACRPEQRTPPGGWNVWLMLGGRGCVAPWTRVYLPLEERWERVDVLARAASPVAVLALGGAGEHVAWTDGAPFVKGVADYWTVELESGEIITATDQHRFLTRNGWRQLADVRPGSLVGVGPLAPPVADSSFPSWSRGDAPRSTGTPSGSPACCPKCPDCGGQPPRRPGGSAQAGARSPAGEPGRTRPPWHEDVLGHAAGRNRPHPPRNRRSKTRCAPLVRAPEGGEAGDEPAIGEPSPRSRRGLPPSLAYSGVGRAGRGPVAPASAGSSPQRGVPCAGASCPCRAEERRARPSGDGPSVAMCRVGRPAPGGWPLPGGPQLEIDRPSLDVTKWSRVVAVRPAGSGPYYDMTVPGAASYLAEGIWNHNSGKTRPGSEDHASYVATHPGVRANLLAPTFADARDTCVEGESGLLSVFERYGWTDGVEYTWNRSIGEINYINGSKCKLFSAEKPARLRGPQHHRMWVDELAQVLLGAIDAWDMMMFGLRLGRNPQVVATTTPLPMQVIKDLVADPTTHVTRMKMVDNLANLAPVMVRKLYAKYGGTEMGKQELDGEILLELPGSLWKQGQLDTDRLGELPDWYTTPGGIQAPFHLIRIVIAVDPAMAGEEESDETGIMVVGLGNDGHLYVLEDASVREDPGVYVSVILSKFDEYRANEIIVETNNGGKTLPDLIRKQEELDGRTMRPVVINMINAKQGKRVRAETPSSLYGQHQVHHVGHEDDYKKLEDQLVTFLQKAKRSPDRLDAVCYGILYLADIAGTNELFSTKQHIPKYSTPSFNRFALSSANNLRR